MKRVGNNEKDNQQGSYTYLEQDYNANGNSRLINKWLPPKNNNDVLNVREDNFNRKLRGAKRISAAKAYYEKNIKGGIYYE